MEYHRIVQPRNRCGWPRSFVESLLVSVDEVVYTDGHN